MKPDLIVCWPKSADYPLFRKNVHEDREKFGKIIIVFTETNIGNNYREFVREVMSGDDVTFLENPPLMPLQDWRDVAIKQALAISSSQWVFFTEQDFFPGTTFWKYVDAYISAGLQVIGVKQGDRIHPCCLFMSRHLLDQLNLDFGAHPPAHDHFGAIQKQIEGMNKPIGILPSGCWKHLNGLSHNMRLVEDGAAPNHDLEGFTEYMSLCFDCGIQLSPKFIETYQKYYRNFHGDKI
jgi:hypothetical protein